MSASDFIEGKPLPERGLPDDAIQAFCPFCGLELILIESESRSLHEAPLCAEYAALMGSPGTSSEGAVVVVRNED